MAKTGIIIPTVFLLFSTLLTNITYAMKSKQQPIVSHFLFKKLTQADWPLLLKWFKEPHVEKWWPTPEKNELLEYFLEKIRSKNTFGFIVYLEEKPIAYIQYYYIDRKNEKTGSWLPSLPDETTVGIDQFIGDSNYLNKGYGTLFIKQFIAELKTLEPEITTIIVDPDPENIAAIRCYGKVGFISLGTYKNPWGTSLIMKYNILKKDKNI